MQNYKSASTEQTFLRASYAISLKGTGFWGQCPECLILQLL